MFTGLIKEKTAYLSREEFEGGYRLQVRKPAGWNDLEVGESIALNGVCLTLEKEDAASMTFFVGLESIAKTNVQLWSSQNPINLERSLTLQDRLGGHMVSGHVDGTALVTEVVREGECLAVNIMVSEALRNWIVPKGSIAVNGVSLTVNEYDFKSGKVGLFLIPETLKLTSFQNLSVGDFVNVECDQTVKTIFENLTRMKEMNELHP